MIVSRLARMPVPRVALAILIAGVLVTGGIAARIGSAPCPGSRSQCSTGGVARWSRPLPGSWIAENGVEGTVASQGQAYAAASNEAAVIGFGLTVSAYDLGTGSLRWSKTLTGLPAGAAIVAVRAWRGVITVGVSPASPPTAGSAGGDAGARREIVLNSMTGRQITMYPAAGSGGAVRASPRRTVIVGQTSVASYANSTGEAVWRDPTGPGGQAWFVAGRSIYVTVSAHGQVGTAPVSAVRRIDLRTGEERLVRPPGSSFDGRLAGVVAGVLVFSDGSGLHLYSAASGDLTGQRPGAVVEGVDPVLGVLYADVRGTLTAIDPVTGQDEPGARAAIPAGVYSVRAGVALGLDQGAGGSAWGYSIAKRHVVWAAKSLPWPHFFAAPANLGGVGSGSGVALLVTCGATGEAVRRPVIASGGRTCLRPMFVAVGARGPRL